MYPRLQPYVSQPATLCIPACKRALPWTRRLLELADQIEIADEIEITDEIAQAEAAHTSPPTPNLTPTPNPYP